MKKLLSKLAAPFLFVGAAIAALFLVIMDAILYGKRLQRRKEIQQNEKDQKAAVDRMAAAGDADGIFSDIMGRVRGTKDKNR